MDYATAAHSCCCGCGEQVITPFTPTDWELPLDGEAVSLWPSIGKWNFRCRSHHIIRNCRIVGAEPWSDKKVEHGRRRDKWRKQEHFGEKSDGTERKEHSENTANTDLPGLWDRIKKKGAQAAVLAAVGKSACHARHKRYFYSKPTATTPSIEGEIHFAQG